MGSDTINKALLARLEANARDIIRPAMNKQRPQVLYVSTGALIKGNISLQKLIAKDANGKLLANEYMSQMITGIDKIKAPAFNIISSKRGGLFRLMAPEGTTALIAMPEHKREARTGKKLKEQKDSFSKLSTKLAEVNLKSNTHMTQFAKSNNLEWTNLKIDTGHVFQEGTSDSTPTLERARGVLDLLSGTGNAPGFDRSNKIDIGGKELRNKDFKSAAQVEALIKKAMGKVEDIHLEFSVSYDREVGTNSDLLGQLRVVMLVPQERNVNQTILGNVEAELGALLTKTVENMRPGHLKGSPSAIEMVTTALGSAFRTGKFKRTKYKTQARRKGKGIKTPKPRLVNRTKSIKTKFPNKIVTSKGGLASVNVLNIKRLINALLSDSVKEQMGNSNEAPIRLRNQTGRFAESAELLTLTRNQSGILLGTYNYQRNPYDVFLPGHRLGTVQRDPRLYIEGGIRKAALSILKGRFPGILLESK